MSAPVVEVVTVSVDELLDRMEERIAQLIPKPAEPQKLLVSGAEMAAMVDVSRTTLHRLRVEGCPAVRVVDTYKFEPSAVLGWLKERK